MASDIREYSYLEFGDKVLSPLSGAHSVVRHSAQLKASARVRLYRDMAHPETVVAEASETGMVCEYPWSLVVASRVAASKVVALQQPTEGQARSSNPQNQRR